jgi:hypothetical protein
MALGLSLEKQILYSDMENLLTEAWYIPVLIAAGSLVCGAFNKWKKRRKK